jgi:SOS response regulatory protein OraA/RecX
MRNARKQWTEGEVRTLKELRVKGANDHDISLALGRSQAAIQLKRSELGMVRKYKTRNALKQGKYTRYMKPKTEVSLLWGLIKYTKP